MPLLVFILGVVILGGVVFAPLSYLAFSVIFKVWEMGLAESLILGLGLGLLFMLLSYPKAFQPNTRSLLIAFSRVWEGDYGPGWRWLKFPRWLCRFVVFDATEQFAKDLVVEGEAIDGVTVRLSFTLTHVVTEAARFFGLVGESRDKVRTKIEAILKQAVVSFMARRSSKELVPVDKGTTPLDDREICGALLKLIAPESNRAYRVEGEWVLLTLNGVKFKIRLTDREEASGEMRKATESKRGAEKEAEVIKTLLGSVFDADEIERLTYDQKMEALARISQFRASGQGSIETLIQGMLSRGGKGKKKGEEEDQ